MATFTGTFKYVTEETYYVKVEAKTLEEALNLIEENPFSYSTTDKPIEEEEDVTDIKIEEKSENKKSNKLRKRNNNGTRS